MSTNASTTPVRISAASEGQVVFTPADFDRFVLTQRDTIDALVAAQERADLERQIGARFGSWIYRVTAWSKEHGIAKCVISPRMDDTLVVVVARDEDDGGALHDAMSAMDLASFTDNRLRLSWLLLRASEAEGLSAFADPRWTRTLFDANA